MPYAGLLSRQACAGVLVLFDCLMGLTAKAQTLSTFNLAARSTVGGNRSLFHSFLRLKCQLRVASNNTRVHVPAPSCWTSRSSSGVLGSNACPSSPGNCVMPSVAAFMRYASAQSICW